jgi:hypothetical protein
MVPILQWGLSLWKTFFSVGAANNLEEMEMDRLESRQADLATRIRPVGANSPV